MRGLSASIFVGTLLLSGCQSSGAFQRPEPGYDYGAPPTIDEEAIKEYIGASLKDEESARYKFDAPLKTYCNNGILNGGKVVWSGWSMPFSVNAKNSYGAYVGYKPYIARYQGDALLDVSTPDGVGTFDYSPKLGMGCFFDE